MLQVLACPHCGGDLKCSEETADGADEILTGVLSCESCSRSFPIVDSIPRFVAADNYASSFGLQWNLFRLEQVDTANRTGLSAQRFYSETGWRPEWMAGKWIFEGGCGAGRFLDVAARTNAEVVGVDISKAVDAARQTVKGLKNVHLVQASIYELPFKRGIFDACYSIGVLQHTPDPQKACQALPQLLKPGGEMAVTVYERRRFTMLYGKYLLRPITRRMNPRLLLALIKLTMPVLFPITEVLFRVPVLKRHFRFVIPVANYVDEKHLTMRQRYQWALLDTFDMLSPRYDYPQTKETVEVWLRECGLEKIRSLPNRAVNLVAVKPAVTSKAGA